MFPNRRFARPNSAFVRSSAGTRIEIETPVLYKVTIDFKSDGETDSYTCTVLAVNKDAAFDSAYYKLSREYGEADDILNVVVELA